jgi:hypothetical protein
MDFVDYSQHQAIEIVEVRATIGPRLERNLKKH